MKPDSKFNQLSHRADEYAQKLPLLSGRYDEDKTALTAYIDLAEQLLSQSETAGKLDSGDRAAIDKVLLSGRQLRASFMQMHVSSLLAEVNIKEDEHELLSELSYRAAEVVPGLVPSRIQMDQELKLEQADKLGRELEQGIFYWGILSHQEAGEQLISKMLLPTKRAINLLTEFEAKGSLNLGKVLIEISGDAAHITFHNSDCLNAEDNQLIQDFETAVDLVLLSKKVKVGVLRGGVVSHPKYFGKRIFSAGINLKHIHQGKISFTDFVLYRELGYINKMLRGLSNKFHGQEYPFDSFEKPWVAAVDTFAIGGGMQLLFACDLVVGTKESYACLPAAKEGIVPGVSNLRLGRISNARLAKQVILHGRKIWASATEGSYIFDEVVEPHEMDNSIQDAIDKLASPAVVPNRKMLLVCEEPINDFRQYMAKFSLEQSKRLYAEDVHDKVKKM